MRFAGIEAVTYGVTNLPKARRFWADFGLEERAGGKASAEFAAANGARVVLKRRSDRSLPPPVEAGPSVRLMTWGLETAEDVEAVRQRLAGAGCLADGPGVRTVDPAGFALDFVVSGTRMPEVAPSPANAPQDVNRIDSRAGFYERAAPLKIGHIVLNVPDAAACSAFYREVLGFHLSDAYDNGSVFLRCAPRHSHHNLFLLQSPTGRPGINHLAFAVRDIHEMFAGGQHLALCGWKTAAGPGRHRISSCYFWYVHNPCGGLAEYFWDEADLPEDWEPQLWTPGP
ncbi:MAG: glyoxalase, partial [Rhodospirillaceae bacterium]|nr:glyoxalase [Rhodospirillaceae bacterium]